MLDNLSSGTLKNLPAGVTFYEVDVRDAAGVEAAVKEFQPSVISHQAAQVSVSASVADPLLDAEINVMGGLNVLQAAHKQGVERFVFASTGGAIYGEVPSGRANETTPEKPYSPYATSKRAFERYLETFAQLYGLEYVNLRYANVYGPRQNPHGEAGVVAIFIERLLACQSIRINARLEEGDEGCLRDYVYVSDVARANLAAAMGRTPSLMNVGTGVTTTTRQLALEIVNLLGVSTELEYGPSRAGDIQRSALDPSLFTRHLGQPSTLNEGLAATVEWFRAINSRG